LDITDRKNVEEVFERLNKDLSETGLQGLVNNAGIGWSAPLEYQPYDHFRKVIEVNLLGHVLMTKTFLPLLRKAKSGRIINIASLAGLLGAPRMSAYCASKFALEGFSDSLRRELRHLDIAVSVIEPAFAKTAIITNGLDYYTQNSLAVTPELQETYAILFPKDNATFMKKIYDNAMDPSVVVDSIVDAYTSPYPRTRYLVGILANVAAVAHWFLPNYAVDWLVEKQYQLLKNRN